MIARFLQDPLLRRELDQHLLRRAGPRNWSYPGPAWFLVSAVLPMLVLCFLRNRRIEGLPGIEDSALFLSAAWQVWLFSLRAVISSSVSVATDVKDRSISVLRTTPVGLGKLLFVKLSVSLFPILTELCVLLPFNLAVYSGFCDLNPKRILCFWLLQLSTTMMFGGLGLWLGSVVGEPERVAGNGRAVVVMGLVGCLLLEKALTWPLMLTGCLIWLCLVVQPQPRPNQAYQGGVTALVLLLLLPFFYGLTLSFVPHFELSEYNPVISLYTRAHILPNALLYFALGAAFCMMSLQRVRSIQ